MARALVGLLLLSMVAIVVRCSGLERAGAITALPTFGSDPVFTGSEARYVVTTEAAGARCAVPADFDGDGDMDLVSVSSSDNTVAWYERLSDGTYGPKNMISRASNGARIVTVGDIDQDNRTDVIVASYYDHTVGWFKNMGGSFSAMNVISRTAISAQGVTVADIDNDGDLDVLTASSGDNTIAWYENLAEGKFCEVKNVVDSNAKGIRTVIAVDLDEDGFMDLAAASKDDNTVSWFRNDQTNHFEKIIIDDTAKGAYSIVAEDVDQDGHMDLIACANMDGFVEHPDNGEGGKVSLYRNGISADGGLASFTKIAVTVGNSTGANDFDWFVLSVWAGDLDMDGDVDIASASFGLLHPGGISWYENVDGSGTQWTRHQIYVTPGVKTGHYIFGADMDGDGDNDLIAVTNGDNKVQILIASTRCDDSKTSPRAECCTAEQYWNGVACMSCDLGSFLDTSAPQGPSCAACSSACPRAGLAFLPATCHSMPACGDSTAAFARCDCGESRFLDQGKGFCAQCPDGHITINDPIRTASDYVILQKSLLDQTKYSVSDMGWSGFNESRCQIPTCEPALFFNMSAKQCELCPAGLYSAGGSITECTPCPPGYACTDGTAIPQSCQVGHYSTEGASICLACEPGKFADAPGSSACAECPSGEFNELVAQDKCNFCSLGTYMENTGATACSVCEDFVPSSTTELLRATNSTACVCKEDTWRGEEASQCTPCPSGVDCSGDDFAQAVKPGFYAREEDFAPFAGVWKCILPDACPGGAVETCADSRQGLACATCPAGMYGSPGEQCQPCSGDKRILVWLLWIAAITAVIVAYYSMNSPLSSKATTLLTTSCAFGLTVTTVQSLGIFSLLNLPWPKNFLVVLKAMSIFMLDPDVLALECAYDSPAAPPRYSTSVMFFFIIEAIIVACSIVSRFILPAKWQWTTPKTLNVMGQFLQVCFTSMVCMALVPMMCYSHPNGEKSLLKFSHVVCGSADHHLLLTFSVPLVALAFAFFAGAVFVAVAAPGMARRGNANFMQASRFLLFRFRPDCWWWGLVLMIRAVLMSLAPVVATDDSRVQMLLIIATLSIAMALQIYFWPWKVPLLNMLDAVISVCLMLVMMIVSSFIKNTVDDDLNGSSKAAFTTLLLVVVGGLYSSLVVLAVMAVIALWARGPLGSPHDSFNLRQAPDTELLSILFHDTADKIAKLPAKNIEKVFSTLPIYDINLVERLITLVEQAGAMPGSGRISWSTRSSSIRQSISEAEGALPVMLGSKPQQELGKTSSMQSAASAVSAASDAESESPKELMTDV